LHADCAVEADRFAVEHGVLDDVGGERPVLGRAPQAGREGHLPTVRELLAPSTPVARTPPPVEPETWEATLLRLTGKDVTRCPGCGAAGFLIVETLPARAELRNFPWRGRSS
jgi:hypothetical protein